jgi:hypothetical protein
MPDGTPDLEGIWQAVNTAHFNLRDHPASADAPPGLGVVDGGEIPYQPWAVERQRENAAKGRAADPEAQCYLPGVPRATYMPYPFHIIQTPQAVTFAYTYAHALRMAYLNRPTLEPGLDWWMGSSRAKWEGDTLVVEVNNLGDQTWLDRAGNFHSEALTVVERYTRTGPDHLLYEATLTDPKVFTRSWKISMPLYRIKDENARILPYDCYAYYEGPHKLTYHGEN